MLIACFFALILPSQVQGLFGHRLVPGGERGDEMEYITSWDVVAVPDIPLHPVYPVCANTPWLRRPVWTDLEVLRNKSLFVSSKAWGKSREWHRV